MSYQWDELQKLFAEFFGEKNISTPTPTQIRHCINGDNHVFLLLEDEGGQCCRLEFVIEYSNHRRDIVDSVAAKTSIREFHTYTHYTDQHWEWRQRITTTEELSEDLKKISDVITPALRKKSAVHPAGYPVKICSNVTAAELLTWELRIPDYQRPYSWREKNIRDFLIDIDLWQKDTNKAGIPYHLGTVILKEQEEKIFDVIDGQQRLTTLAILAIVKKAQDFENELPLLNSKKTYYSGEEIQTLLRAREYIKSSECAINFEQIELSVVVLSKDQQEDQAYTFFSNSNSTGKHLSDYDLLKTHHLRYIANDIEATRFSKRWHDLERSGKQDDVLQNMLFRLRKWSNNEYFPLDANNRESRELFNHYKSLDPLRNFFSPTKTPCRFNSLLSGGSEFFSYTEYYRKKYAEFIEFDVVKQLEAHLSGHSNGVIYAGIKALAFLFFCKFGDLYLKEAVYLLAYRLSEVRNETRVMSQYLSEKPIFGECVRLLDQVTCEAQFFAVLSDVKKRYEKKANGGTAKRYWDSLDALMKHLEKQNLAVGKMEQKNEQNKAKEQNHE